MNIIECNGGTNSTAMLISLHRRKISADLILFADSSPTPTSIPIMNACLTSHGVPEITVVEYTGQNDAPVCR